MVVVVRRLTCTFRARLSWALVLTWVSPFAQDKKTWIWVGGRVGYLITTFALKEHYRTV